MAHKELWTTRSLPLLEWMAAHEGGHVNLGTIAAELGFPAEEVEAELLRLDSDDLVRFDLRRVMGSSAGHLLRVIAVTGEGARRLGLWPSADDLLAAVEQMEQEASDPQERSRWRALAGAIRQIGVPVLTQTLEAYVKQKMGLPP